MGLPLFHNLQKTRTTMNEQAVNPNSIRDLSRCQHLDAGGRRCRLPIVGGSRLCYTHTCLERKHEQEDISARLAGELTQFKSAADINRALSRLFILLAQNRVTTRRAAVLAGIGNLLLRTLPAIRLENQPHLVIDLPRQPAPPIAEDAVPAVTTASHADS